MQLGIGSYTYPWAIGVADHPPARPLTALGLLDRAASLRVGLVQVCDNLPLHRLSPAEFDAFQARAAALRLTVEVGARGVDPDHLRIYLTLAKRLGSPLLRLVPGGAGAQPSEDEIVALLRPLLPALERAGVRLALENYEALDVQAWARIVRRLGSDHVGICLDTVNSFGALDGLRTVLETLGPWTINLHIKDVAIQRADHNLGFVVEGRPAGQGQLNVPWLLETLRGMGRSPSVILEQWPPPEPALADTIAKEALWAEEGLAFLRPLLR
jgi:sugar phosphate isomerase/epimerase